MQIWTLHPCWWFDKAQFWPANWKLASCSGNRIFFNLSITLIGNWWKIRIWGDDDKWKLFLWEKRNKFQIMKHLLPITTKKRLLETDLKKKEITNWSCYEPWPHWLTVTQCIPVRVLPVWIKLMSIWQTSNAHYEMWWFF